MTALYVRREAVGRVERGDAVSSDEVAVVLGTVGPNVDTLSWGGMRSIVAFSVRGGR